MNTQTDRLDDDPETFVREVADDLRDHDEAFADLADWLDEQADRLAEGEDDE